MHGLTAGGLRSPALKPAAGGARKSAGHSPAWPAPIGTPQLGKNYALAHPHRCLAVSVSGRGKPRRFRPESRDQEMTGTVAKREQMTWRCRAETIWIAVRDCDDRRVDDCHLWLTAGPRKWSAVRSGLECRPPQRRVEIGHRHRQRCSHDTWSREFACRLHRTPAATAATSEVPSNRVLNGCSRTMTCKLRSARCA